LLSSIQNVHFWSHLDRTGTAEKKGKVGYSRAGQCGQIDAGPTMAAALPAAACTYSLVIMIYLVQETVPTLGFEYHSLAHTTSPIDLEIIDIAGQSSFRNLWSVAYHDADAVVIVADVTDMARSEALMTTLEEMFAAASGLTKLIQINDDN
jgi:GTPase SAR1 family protein